MPARNAALDAQEREKFRDNYPRSGASRARWRRSASNRRCTIAGARRRRNERRAKYEARWNRGGLTFMAVFNDLALDEEANETAASFVREKIAETVKDPETAKLLQPDNHPIGSKRICIDTAIATFNRPNV